VNLPNKITLLRIIIVPIFMAFLLIQSPKGNTLFPHQEIVAAIIFILASITDGLDGYIARSRGMVTNLGKFMDPLADKLLVSAALISLVQLGDIPAWVVWVILAREFAVTGLRAVSASEGTVISASKLGKIKTIMQVIAISVLLLHDWPLSLAGIYLGTPLLYLALLITVISGIDYFLKARRKLLK
jgi:CDP-diacylglycerol--glycerol-3-phosphate 3-phosphatidyltransferase